MSVDFWFGSIAEAELAWESEGFLLMNILQNCLRRKK
jgi:hypothetical protein